MRKQWATDEEVNDFLMYWYETDGLRDFNMAIDSGHVEYAAWIIWSAGALAHESEFSKESQEYLCTKQIKFWMRDYEKKRLKKDHKDCFAKATVFKNEATGEYVFVKNKYVDYLVSIEDMSPCGDYDHQWKVIQTYIEKESKE